MILCYADILMIMIMIIIISVSPHSPVSFQIHCLQTASAGRTGDRSVGRDVASLEAYSAPSRRWRPLRCFRTRAEQCLARANRRRGPAENFRIRELLWFSGAESRDWFVYGASLDGLQNCVRTLWNHCRFVSAGRAETEKSEELVGTSGFLSVSRACWFVSSDANESVAQRW